VVGSSIGGDMRKVEFQVTDMGNLEFVVGQKFPSIQVFREAVRECNENGEGC